MPGKKDPNKKPKTQYKKSNKKRPKSDSEYRPSEEPPNKKRKLGNKESVKVRKPRAPTKKKIDFAYYENDEDVGFDMGEDLGPTQNNKYIKKKYAGYRILGREKIKGGGEKVVIQGRNGNTVLIKFVDPDNNNNDNNNI